MNVLILKITSMGDIIHTFPAVTAAHAAHPELQIDWVVAPEFADLLSLHPAVRRAVLCPLRRWRGRYWQALRNGEMSTFLRDLRADTYDLVIDAQSALKTGVMARLAHGPAHGYDAQAVREYGAQWGYQHRHAVDTQQHAITRLQQLFASALNYSAPSTLNPDYGLSRAQLKPVSFTLPPRFVLVIPNTTWTTKLWPEQQWFGLFRALEQAGLPVLIPCGNAREQQRAEQWSQRFQHVRVLPALTLRECGYVMTQATAAVCVDTGLGHLAAALQTPSLHLYGPTDPEKIGARGPQQTILRAPEHCETTCKRRCYHDKTPSDSAYCLRHLSWETVWQALQRLL